MVRGHALDARRSACDASVTAAASAAAGVPWLSWRAGAFHLVTQATPGFRSEHLYCDRIHPNFVGHRCSLMSRGVQSARLGPCMPLHDAAGRCLHGLNCWVKRICPKAISTPTKHIIHDAFAYASPTSEDALKLA